MFHQTNQYKNIRIKTKKKNPEISVQNAFNFLKIKKIELHNSLIEHKPHRRLLDFGTSALHINENNR